jgi:hypothetical protein
MADQNKDSLFDNPKANLLDLANSRGKDFVYNDIIGLANFMRSYKIVEKK